MKDNFRGVTRYGESLQTVDLRWGGQKQKVEEKKNFGEINILIVVYHQGKLIFPLIKVVINNHPVFGLVD